MRKDSCVKILNSYQIKFPGIEVNGGGIHAIAWTIGKSHDLPLRLIAEGSVLYYVYFALFSIMLTLLFSIFKFKKLDQLGLAIFLNFLIFMGCLGITYVFWDIGRLISIYTITTLLSIEVLAAGLEKFEERSSLRFQSKSILLEKTKTNLLLGLILLYLVFINLITRVEHCCPQPAQIPLRSIFGIFN